MKKLLILSGKGGTGKTTTAAAFVRFSNAKAVSDCDVDAPNLHLVMAEKNAPDVSTFLGGDKAYVDAETCIGCGKCFEKCRFGAIKKQGDKYFSDVYACEGCGVCAYVCPAGAVTMKTDVAGEKQLYRHDRVFSTATLKMGRGNSGKLVSSVKKAMTENAKEAELAIIDGSPGIGCPVIASISGVDLVLIVAEPSLSGKSDLIRIVKTARQFMTQVCVCINKADTSPENTADIKAFLEKEDIPFVGEIPYDKKAAEANNTGKSVAEIDCPAREALRKVYEKTSLLLG